MFFLKILILICKELKHLLKNTSVFELVSAALSNQFSLRLKSKILRLLRTRAQDKYFSCSIDVMCTKYNMIQFTISYISHALPPPPPTCYICRLFENSQLAPHRCNVTLRTAWLVLTFIWQLINSALQHFRVLNAILWLSVLELYPIWG